MKINNKRLREFLILLLVAQTINLGLFKGLEIAEKGLGQYIYQSMTAPFLAQSLQNTIPQVSSNTFVGGSEKIAKLH